MSKHLVRDLQRLQQGLLAIGSMVEGETAKAIAALVERRRDLAAEVRTSGAEIDRREVELEEECLKVLALHQPVATDLRMIVMVLKVNNDLERMGDVAINIAERAAFLAQREPLGLPLDFPRMATTVRGMVRDVLDALVNLDVRLAKKVIVVDDQVDAIHKEMYGILQQQMLRDPATIERAIHLLSASRHLERIADLATNIAEDVVFMVDGEVIRHHPERAVQQD